MAAQKSPGWCRCNGQLVVRGEKADAGGKGLRQKTGCLACGERAVRWVFPSTPRAQQEAGDGQD